MDKLGYTEGWTDRLTDERTHDRMFKWSTAKVIEYETHVVVLISICGQSNRYQWSLFSPTRAYVVDHLKYMASLLDKMVICEFMWSSATEIFVLSSMYIQPVVCTTQYINLYLDLNCMNNHQGMQSHKPFCDVFELVSQISKKWPLIHQGGTCQSCGSGWMDRRTDRPTQAMTIPLWS